jgi:hypothetical protein
MFRPRSAVLVAGALAAATLPATAAAAPTVTHTIRSGSTTLTLSPQSVANLQSMGITMTATAPATTAGTVLKFPVKPGTKIRTKGTNTIVSGRIGQRGGLMLAKGTATVTLTNLITTFGTAKPTLSGSFAGTPVSIATLTVRPTKTRIAARSMRVTGVSVRLTSAAAGALNTAFGVTGFKANDLVGTAAMTVAFR